MIAIRIGRWQLTLILYAIVIGVILYFKPPLMFDAEGNPKHFAVENTSSTSPFAPVVAFPLMAFLMYFVVATIDLSYS